MIRTILSVFHIVLSYGMTILLNKDFFQKEIFLCCNFQFLDSKRHYNTKQVKKLVHAFATDPSLHHALYLANNYLSLSISDITCVCPSVLLSIYISLSSVLDTNTIEVALTERSESVFISPYSTNHMR